MRHQKHAEIAAAYLTVATLTMVACLRSRRMRKLPAAKTAHTHMSMPLSHDMGRPHATVDL